MSLLDQLGAALGGNEAQASQQFQQVAQQSSPSVLSGMLGNIFQSSETGSFGQNISQMFGQSDPNQRAGILNKLIGAIGPGALAQFGLGGLGGGVSPQQAQQVTPDQVEQVANHAQQQNPDIVHEAAGFYAQHPQLVQALGAGVALWALNKYQHR